jgi:molecular chaperone HscB
MLPQQFLVFRSSIYLPSSRREFVAKSRQSEWFRGATVFCNRKYSSIRGSGIVDDEVNDDDAFRLFSLPLIFKIDENLLRFKYREIMKDLHPDKQRNKSEMDQQKLEKQAAAITHAYDVLKRPHLRATHLLNLLGGPSISSDIADETIQPPQEFLMLVMELGEMIDSVYSDEELKPFFEANRKRIEHTCERLGLAFAIPDLKKAAELTTELNYWNRIDETLRGKMESLE